MLAARARCAARLDELADPGQRFLKRSGSTVDAGPMGERRWLIAAASVLAAAVLLGSLVHPLVGSGLQCEGIGFGCTPERAADTLLIVAVYAALAFATLFLTRRLARRGRPWRTALAAGVAITGLATAAAVWSQLPRHPASPGPLSAAGERWERVLADGRTVAARGTPLGDALRGLARRGPLMCRDAYGRSTGARAFHWSNRGRSDAYAASSDSSGTVTAAALGRWADRLRRRGVEVLLTDPSGEPASDRRLRVGRFGVAAGGVLYVRASFYISELEITATTGCHRD
jgi:hypothetical protein